MGLLDGLVEAWQRNRDLSQERNSDVCLDQLSHKISLGTYRVFGLCYFITMSSSVGLLEINGTGPLDRQKNWRRSQCAILNINVH